MKRAKGKHKHKQNPVGMASAALRLRPPSNPLQLAPQLKCYRYCHFDGLQELCMSVCGGPTKVCRCYECVGSSLGYAASAGVFAMS